ncbi:EamA domain-containing membrane protein RarD [Thermoflavifilum aggregans]|uniref:EamA domain-containing membrane protein RarD n=1 Tax=Thermoflavifilum aggregans TaxID=454188 RepID=A0A2M9CTP7_9BACT|nr:DMT family transporter [Thermoflavifilum aggregans]PJJ75294.1 EamA domain-containing membrane protein RarD [Thermoflavifilum aggregans]
MNAPKSGLSKALVELHVAILLAGITGPLGRLITLPAEELVWYRLGLSMPLFAVLSLWYQKPARPAGRLVPRFTHQQWTMLATNGALIGFHWICFFSSVKYANVSVALVCFATSSLFTALLDPVVNRNGLRWRQVGLSLLALAGIVVIFQFNTQYRLGIVFGLLAAVLSALFTLLNEKPAQQIQARTLSMYELLFAWLILSLVSPWYLRHHSIHWPAPMDWMYLLILSWLCTVFAFTLSLSALKHISPFTINLSYNLEPIYGILIAFALFHENRMLDTSFYVGFACIFLSVLMQTLYTLYKHRTGLVVSVNQRIETKGGSVFPAEESKM